MRSAEAVLAEAGRALDSARVALAGNPRDDDAAATASVAVATARVATSEAALATSNGLFEVAGARAAVDPLGLHRLHGSLDADCSNQGSSYCSLHPDCCKRGRGGDHGVLPAVG